jgi:hypothetical protein
METSTQHSSWVRRIVLVGYARVSDWVLLNLNHSHYCTDFYAPHRAVHSFQRLRSPALLRQKTPTDQRRNLNRPIPTSTAQITPPAHRVPSVPHTLSAPPRTFPTPSSSSINNPASLQHLTVQWAWQLCSLRGSFVGGLKSFLWASERVSLFWKTLGRLMCRA